MKQYDNLKFEMICKETLLNHEKGLMDQIIHSSLLPVCQKVFESTPNTQDQFIALVVSLFTMVKGTPPLLQNTQVSGLTTQK